MLLRAVKPRSFPSLTRTYIKDAYKKIDYEAPFEAADKERLLRALKSARNPEELNSLGVTKAVATNLTRHLAESRPLEILEHLLDVRKMDVVKMERLCKTVLKRLDERDNQEQELENPNRYAKYRKQIHPKSIPHLISDIYGIKFGPFSVSFCQLQRRAEEEGFDEVANWSCSDVEIQSLRKHDQIYAAAFKVADEMRISDDSVFVFEETPNLLQGGKKSLDLRAANAALGQAAFQAGLVSLLNKNGINRTFEMKKCVIDEMFNLRVGFERTATYNKLSEIVKRDEFRTRITAEIWSQFRLFPNADREHLSIAALIAAAFSKVTA